ncbi:short transient receptor potential channel 3-like [Lytechinus variegatus]|uniref:short transient receptor potential channel 3-like n=1 Tax=Lytechinus variegatus TaxID=7654 RepID=UPI001BB130DF|nr:short transient receptor potential channel 3-like [Lytechinus variegatus]
MPQKKRLLSRGLSRLIGAEEAEFLNAVSHGNLAYVKSTLGVGGDENGAIKALLHLKDTKDRTALEIATENEHYDIVVFIVEVHGCFLGVNDIHESLMLAISKGYLNITQVLLDHPCFDEKKNRAMQTLGRHETFYDRNYHSKFARDVTPVMMASMYNEVDILRLLLERGDDVVKPHHPLCGCTTCLNRKEFDPLMHSLSIINAYRALCSEAYISLTSEDPILTAFLLSKELNNLCKTEKEFKNEYKELIKKCKTFASNLLDMCQNTEEVKTILKQTAISETEVRDPQIGHPPRALGGKVENEKEDENALPRLEMAIEYHQKQFVAHPHCQHHLATLWYQGFPQIRLMQSWMRVFILPLFLPLLPIAVIIYLIYPKGKFGNFMRSPIIKFINQSVMYMVFLLLMFMESVTEGTSRLDLENIEDVLLASNSCAPYIDDIGVQHDIKAKIRDSGSAIEFFLFIMVLGLIWQEVKQIWREGLHTYVSSIWNWIDLAMLNLLLSSLVIVFMSMVFTMEAQRFFLTDGSCEALANGSPTAEGHFYFLTGDRTAWENNDLNLIGEGLFAMANVLSFSRLSFILPASEFLGPLQISLGRMMGDISRFAAVFFVVFLAFFCAMCNLYWYYPDNSSFGSMSNALTTLVWALFGLGDTSNTSCPDDYPDCGHASTEVFGVLLYSSYMGIMVIVMLNMLIAMMSTSFDEINNDEDVEWKFSRSKLWLSYFERGATLPVPFNLIPSPKTIIKNFMWASHKLIKTNSSKRIASHRPISQSNLRKAVRRNVTSHEDLMKKVVKRYLFKLQRAHDTDEIDEGELEEIKNDISSFRFDVLEELGNISSKVDSKLYANSKMNNVKPAREKGGPSMAKIPENGEDAGKIDDDFEKVADEITQKMDVLSEMIIAVKCQFSQILEKGKLEPSAQ